MKITIYAMKIVSITLKQKKGFTEILCYQVMIVT